MPRRRPVATARFENATKIDSTRPRVRRPLFFADDKGHIYRFAEDGPRWSYLGRLQVPAGRYWVWVFDVSRDGESAFIATSSWEMPPTLYRFDFADGTTTRLCGLAALDLPYPEHTGYDAWDREGRFYLASFGGGADENVIVTRVDPQRLGTCSGSE